MVIILRVFELVLEFLSLLLAPKNEVLVTHLTWHVSEGQRQRHACVTWEMLTPVSFSTASGRRVMMSSTSPDSLAAPTSPSPLDTMVTLLASHKGLLISSAIWWKWTVINKTFVKHLYKLLHRQEKHEECGATKWNPEKTVCKLSSENWPWQ